VKAGPAESSLSSASTESAELIESRARFRPARVSSTSVVITSIWSSALALEGGRTGLREGLKEGELNSLPINKAGCTFTSVLTNSFLTPFSFLYSFMADLGVLI
jgi:hypothetical protein